jgi:hypothetical protein
MILLFRQKLFLVHLLVCAFLAIQVLKTPARVAARSPGCDIDIGSLCLSTQQRSELEGLCSHNVCSGRQSAFA